MGIIRFVVLEDGETYGGFDGSNLVEIDENFPGLDEAYDGDDAVEFLLENGIVIPLIDLLGENNVE